MAPAAIAIPPPEPGGGPVSQVLRALAERLAPLPDARLLDVGPVCGANIELLARRTRRLYVCDLFLRMVRDAGRGIPLELLWRHLNYPKAHFDAILLWGLLERLPDGQARRLAHLLRHLLRPGGLVGLTMQGEAGAREAVEAMVMAPDLSLTPRPQPHLTLPLYGRPNRLIRDLMVPLRLTNSFVYRNGLREFLFERG